MAAETAHFHVAGTTRRPSSRVLLTQALFAARLGGPSRLIGAASQKRPASISGLVDVRGRALPRGRGSRKSLTCQPLKMGDSPEGRAFVGTEVPAASRRIPVNFLPARIGADSCATACGNSARIPVADPHSEDADVAPVYLASRPGSGLHTRRRLRATRRRGRRKTPAVDGPLIALRPLRRDGIGAGWSSTHRPGR